MSLQSVYNYQNQSRSPTGYFNSQMPQSNDPPAIEDVQEIITQLPLPSQLPVINLPLRVMNNTRTHNTIERNQAGIVLSQGNFNGASPRASFVLPPSVIIRQ